ncbi:Protein suppressor of silencing [Frankliniella fusca]|uniref:Protein suppressor of silencing n=1 Tax=Frankliniella fusca TaxID=407009 RepID=A0AAE1LF22_9NEOP|nr:Protein suppressor of silencing [Frankliniella fusca]
MDVGEMHDNENENGNGASSEEEVEDARVDALELLPNGRRDIRHAAVNMLVDMRSVPGMTRIGVRRAMCGAELVVKVNNMSLKEEVSEFLNRTGQFHNPRAQRLLTKFDDVNPFKGFKSDDGQRAGIQKYFHYVAPETVFIDERMDQRLLGEGAYGLVPVPNSYQYASVIQFLKMLARKTDVMDYMTNRRPSVNGMIEGYTDGDEFREHPFFQRYPDAFQLCLYGDGVDPARMAGPKSGLHEIYIFSISVLNLPPALLYSGESIFPLVMANAQDCKETFAGVLGRFVQELQQLEGDGVREFFNGAFRTIRATLVAVKGDAKAVHEMLGFLPCSARHFCPQCMISRPELHLGQIVMGEIRTQAMTDLQLQRVGENPAYATNCGLRYRTCLHDSRYFRAENNQTFDLMHDGPEGIMMMLIRLCLKRFVCIENLFGVEELNQRIFAYNYGSQNSRDRPTPNFTYESLQNAETVHSQKMNAAQTLLLFRVLPFLLDSIGQNGIDEENEFLQYLLLLSEIFQIGSAPRVPRSVLPYLRRLLETFRVTWYILFPNVPPINKLHHLMHLAENILRKGPQRTLWCFKEEGKNCPLRRHVVVCNNFKNPQKTAMEQAQIRVSKVWGTHSDTVEYIRKFVKKRNITVSTSPARIHLLALGFEDPDEIRVCDAITVKSFVYRKGEFLLYSKASENHNGLPRFGKILSIICPEDSNHTWFVIEPWTTVGLVERFNGYAIIMQENPPIHLIDLKDLPLHPAISKWGDYSSDVSYLCLKYKVY